MSTQAEPTPSVVTPPPRPAPAPASPRRGGPWRWLRTNLPTFLALAVVIGLGILGHLNDWQIPAWSKLIGDDDDDDDDDQDWCDTHNVPMSKCVEHNKDLLPVPKGVAWCDVHGVPECPVHYPQVAQVHDEPTVPASDL